MNKSGKTEQNPTLGKPKQYIPQIHTLFHITTSY